MYLYMSYMSYIYDIYNMIYIYIYIYIYIDNFNIHIIYDMYIIIEYIQDFIWKTRKSKFYN